MVVSREQKRSSVKAKPGRPAKRNLIRKKPSALDKMTINQIVSHEKEKAKCKKVKRATLDDLYENDEVKHAVIERAKEIQDNLSSKFPSFIKCMLPSHVSGGFWLGLAKEFCSKHLPEKNKMLVLEDEEGGEYKTNYLVDKVGLNGGWKGFSIAHNLLMGDVCVFHLVKPTKFKVYIVRKKASEEADVAFSLLKLEASIQEMDHGKSSLSLIREGAKICEKTTDKSGENYEAEETIISEDTAPKQKEMDLENDDPTHSSSHSSEELRSEVIDGIKLCDSVVDFAEVRSFRNFIIAVNGLIINSELSEYYQRKYYDLCRSQNSYLHDHLVKGLNCKLVCGIISETVNIAEAIRAAEVTTPVHSLETWNSTLKPFQGLGMKVGFLSARLEQLISLSLKFREAANAPW
ncbi:hypothetical protein CCACVL1_05770 [Corchorus capsularis]|uniref:TF-B3 domain-containing protein n=1 Tax=Corchorus capsularis TaxID=210143 RepID=A0A1R3JJ15_COCAP|nr:hypothetical protein CCACVL1_05770 [Corchorus capsularis]